MEWILAIAGVYLLIRISDQLGKISERLNRIESNSNRVREIQEMKIGNLP